ncbi:DUF881 domain-containing protein [Aeromicrobium sp. REDSEA-S32_B7]|uniref:DUF881 domain-containing protein n=1 Tax=Aeromicrobium sp. REDSEA-S32_B7 TaxID=1811526 RepID=UPI000AF2CC59|nr:DUF881 domain-containing protein [Aeromicrobium sp. REDSEA-S32_B7]
MPDAERPHRAAPHRRAGSQVLVALLVGGLAFAMTVQVRQDDATDYGSLRGVGATGPGVRLTVSDPDGLVDAGLVLDVLQELREAGAEAIVVNDTARVVAQTYVLDDEQGLRIGGRQVSSPYVFDVIGDPSTLEESITFRGGVRDLLQARGAQAAVARRSTITITALADVRTPEYARPDVGAP